MRHTLGDGQVGVIDDEPLLRLESGGDYQPLPMPCTQHVEIDPDVRIREVRLEQHRLTGAWMPEKMTASIAVVGQRNTPPSRKRAV